MERYQGIKRLATGGFVAAILVGASLVVVPAIAQQGPDGAPPPWGHHHPGGPEWGGPGPHLGHLCADLDAGRAGAVAFLEVKLGITDAQKPAWTKLVDKIKLAETPVKALCTEVVGKPEPKTVPEHLARLQLMVGTANEVLHEVQPAIDELYGQLTPAQQQIADELLAHMHHHPPHPPEPPHP